MQTTQPASQEAREPGSQAASKPSRQPGRAACRTEACSPSTVLVGRVQAPAEHGVREALCEAHRARAEDGGLERQHQLGQLPPGEAICALRDIFQELVVDLRVNLDALAALRGLVQVPGEEQLEHLHPLLEGRDGELEGLVDAVDHRAVEDARHVRREDHGDARVLGARVVEEDGQGVPRVLAHAIVAAAPLAQERVRLVDEEHQAALRARGPIEELVQLLGALVAQRPEISARHDGVVKARLLRESPREERLPRARRAEEEQVAEGGAVLLRAEQSVGGPLQPLGKGVLHHDLLEEVRVLRGPWPLRQRWLPSPPRGLPHEGRPAEVLLQHRARHAGGGPRAVDAERERRRGADHRHALGRVLVERHQADRQA
mmetsp:Transcript_4374/g.11888  ORF Transcript_4374/g.11888 Transcript_4374/m.11888 type:complete len:374 (-) Transcript_4374:683-1804(-)